MDRVFSVEEMSDHFWAPPPSSKAGAGAGEPSKMNRSASEWAFQRFIQEASVSVTSPQAQAQAPPPPPPPAPPSPSSVSEENDVVEIKVKDKPNPSRVGASANIPVDSEEYQAFLKSKLNLACAAVAMTRGAFGKVQDSAASADCGSQVSNTSQSVTQAPPKGAGHDVSRSQDKDANGPLGIPALPVHNNSVAPLRPATSGSSREQSDDDELEGETEITEGMDPSDVKRVRS